MTLISFSIRLSAGLAILLAMLFTTVVLVVRAACPRNRILALGFTPVDVRACLLAIVMGMRFR